jgi:negative regulator of flagellin synthesis FlgM
MSIEVNNINPNRPDTIRNKRDDAATGNDVNKPNSSNSSPQVPAKSGEASVTLSTTAQNLNKLEEGIKNLPDFDAERVEELRSAIADGKYEIDNKELARKMLDLG